MDLKCSRCDAIKAMTLFPVSKGKAHRANRGYTCNECMREYTHKHYRLHRGDYLARSKQQRLKRASLLRTVIRRCKDKPCADCHITYAWYQMDFDHIGDKKFCISLSASLGKTVEEVMVEIGKCEVVCANCHRKRTHDRRQHKI
jgi:hypothetical protein